MKKNAILLFSLLMFFKMSAQQTDSLTPAERQGIVFLREEEKLARDVYDSLFAKWGENPFGNIVQSEQRHMDKMKELLQHYDISDPVKVTNDKPGEFANILLRQYYVELITTGSRSLADALSVGARIEELDIRDLNSYLQDTKNKRLLSVYTYLKMASENHLRAFVRRLRRNDVYYKPVILGDGAFNSIIENKNAKDAGCDNN